METRTSADAAAQFEQLFAQATGNKPYDYQRRLALAPSLPELLNVPTGLGKTAAVVLSWIWRRRFSPENIQREQTPRRLVYCLPMRTLVEQTQRAASSWIGNLDLSDEIGVHVLMGGTEASDWDRFPERDAILIGTQDMLLSRALNRGYAISRTRWPMQFALLNNDALWVMDETQLMGVGLTTSAQLQGLREKLSTYGNTQSLWVSATLEAGRVGTIDHRAPPNGFRRHALDDTDRAHARVAERLNARKPLSQSEVLLSSETERVSYARDLAASVASNHQAGTLSLVVLNRVSRAQDVYSELKKLALKKRLDAETALVHSRFRPTDRARHEQLLFSADIPASGRIVVATQAIEAGVDVSSSTIFTELAPWPSLVQRFGRCNRYGESHSARVFWIDVQPKGDKDKISLPYEPSELEKSRRILGSLADVGPGSVESVAHESPERVVHTLRRKDLLDLWDTTPDISGVDLDVSRFIRDGDDTDVQVYWREWDGKSPSEGLSEPSRDELCTAAIGRAREFLLKHKKNQRYGYVWRPLEGDWQQLDPGEVRPGMVLLLNPELGGYLDELGWTGNLSDRPTPHPPDDAESNDAIGADRSSFTGSWIGLSEHLRDVEVAAEELGREVWAAGIPWRPIVTAARWHDVGKSHPAFQNMLLRGHPDADARRTALWAKSHPQSNGTPRYYADAEEREERKGFRHELASALAWLASNGDHEHADLIAFLIAAHHGKVRGSIRSLPNESVPGDPGRLFARGIWQGDQLPEVHMAQGEVMPATVLNLELMRLGEGDDGQPSWLARSLALRDEYGPFRLSYLETLLRVADWRGSTMGEQRYAR